MCAESVPRACKSCVSAHLCLTVVPPPDDLGATDFEGPPRPPPTDVELAAGCEIETFCLQQTNAVQGFANFSQTGGKVTT